MDAHRAIRRSGVGFVEADEQPASSLPPANVLRSPQEAGPPVGTVGAATTAPSSPQAQLTEVLDAATQVSICATDLSGVITLFNSGAEKMLGYRAQELIGRHTPEVFHVSSEIEQRGDELSRELKRAIRGFEVFVAHAKDGKYERREWTYVRKDGRRLTVNLVVTAMRNAAGRITGFLGVAEDITERKRSEAALRKSEERFHLAVAGSHDGIWDWDVLTDEVYYAPRFKQLLGYGDAEFANTFAAFEAALHPEDRLRTLQCVEQHLLQRAPYDVEYRLRTKSGEYRWFHARGQAIWDAAGRPVRMAGSLSDVTERRESAAALEAYAAEIERANNVLRVAEADAREAILKRDQFLAMLSHELRNPLSAILNGIAVLEHGAAQPEAIAEAREVLSRQALHMSRLLDDLLDVARITQGKIGFRRRLLDVNELVREAEQSVRSTILARGQVLQVACAPQPVAVEGDETRLLQVIDNLLTNASKYSPAGGAIRVAVETTTAQCELTVADDGRGIESDMLEDIFDMFVQSDSTLDRSDGGMGVGLTLVRTLVEMHGGSVAAASDGPGCGSQFIVRLPLASPGMEQPRIVRPAPREVGLSVALVEDNADSREMLKSILELEGFYVKCAEDGRQGVELILAESPDVAVIDIGLPIMDGYQVAREVRGRCSVDQPRLIALTGYGQVEDRHRVLAAGFDEHLVKPVEMNRLLDALAAADKPR